jgi:hypothetical protein
MGLFRPVAGQLCFYLNADFLGIGDLEEIYSFDCLLFFTLVAVNQPSFSVTSSSF